MPPSHKTPSKSVAGQRQLLAQLRALEGPLERALCSESLSAYIRLAWPIIEPDTSYLHNWHIDLMAEYLTACTDGQITRLVINIPPRYMKSIATSIMWPTWVWVPVRVRAPAGCLRRIPSAR